MLCQSHAQTAALGVEQSHAHWEAHRLGDELTPWLRAAHPPACVQWTERHLGACVLWQIPWQMAARLLVAGLWGAQPRACWARQ